MTKNTKIVIGILAVVAIILVVIVLQQTSGPRAPGKLDTFASCLKSNGAIFYGAFWCPHCQNQKAMFGNSVSFLPYVECSNPDQSQNATCNEKGIQSYPTWIFKDGSQLTGEVPLDQLAQKTGCTLPK